jgi:hypothetical protein
MSDFVHPLDPWGHTMLGMDTGGKVCFWGTEALKEANADGAYKYCSRVYGWSGPTLILASAGYKVPGSGVDAHQLKLDFMRCRYFTHMAETTLLALQKDGILAADGTPDGGCRKLPVIVENDPTEMCPRAATIPLDEKALAAGIIAVVITSVCLFFTGLCWCIRVNKKIRYSAPEGAEDEIELESIEPFHENGTDSSEYPPHIRPIV